MAENNTLDIDNLRDLIRDNPHIITGDPGLMAVVRSGLNETGVVDLGQRFRDRLEKDLSRTKATNEALINLAKMNLAVQSQIHSAVLAVLEASSLTTLDRKLSGRVAGTLNVDIIRVFLEGHSPVDKGMALKACSPDLVEALLHDKAERLGVIDTRFCDALYGDKAAGFRSEALVRLDISGRAGVLCLASRSERAFSADQGTDFLHFFARVLERKIAPDLRL